MAYQTVFHLISDIINKSGISCILIGGFAVNYYNVTRMTADVDFLIVKEDFEKILKLLEKANYKVDFSDKVFVRLTTNIRSNLMDIDFMFVDNETLNKIIKDGQKVHIANQEFIVPSLNNLIALKIHSLKYNFKYRENKDLPDIVDLIRINKIDCRMEEFRMLCLKYGTEEIYQKILERV